MLVPYEDGGRRLVAEWRDKMYAIALKLQVTSHG